jgi:hypothetical protein
MEFIANNNLVWQRANNTNWINPPQLIHKNLPNWLKTLRGNIDTYTQSTYHHLTVRHCLGMRGLLDIGYSLPIEYAPGGNYSKIVKLHPEQLHGTRWAEIDQQNNYIWDIFIVSFPWRAKMPPGWRLLINDYPLDWHADYHCFTGAVDANYEIRNNGCDIGSLWNYDYKIDEHHNYFNLETVLAIKQHSSGVKIWTKAGACIFSAIPVYDPDHKNSAPITIGA